MKRIIAVILCLTGFVLGAAAQNRQTYQVPVMPNPAARKAVLEKDWAAMQAMPPQIGVREWFLFLVDALDTRFLKDEQVEWLLKKLQTRLVSNPAAGNSSGNMYWGWHETGFDVGDGNNVQFCVQYGILVKLLFNDRLSKAAAKTLDEIFMLATKGVLNQEVRISYANIYLMKVWNLVALGEVYHQPEILENGGRLFDRWLNHVSQYGIREYDSPTYSGVDLESLLLLYTFSKDAAIHAKAGDALNFLLTDLAAHYNRRAGILGGAHSRDYNRVFSRDLLEEKYFNPLLGGKNNNTHLFNQVCLSALQKLGLSAAQKELMGRENRFIVQRWDSLANTYACDFVGKKVSIASANQTYSPDDKPFVMYLSSQKIPAMPNIAYVMEGRDDHYGTWSSTGMGDRMKSRMPANYPANGGWNKTRHLMPFLQSAQNKAEFVMLAAGEKDHNCINDYLNSTIILPDVFDEIWLGNQKVKVPDVGSAIELDTTKTLFAKFEDVAIAFRILWDDAGTGTSASLYNDGFKFLSAREQFQLEHNKTLRLTLRHSGNGKAAIAMWWKAAEGVKTAADFLKFRKEVLNAPVMLKVQDGVLDVAVMTAKGKLGVKADLVHRKRLAYYNPSPMPAGFLYQVDGVEIARPSGVLDKRLGWVDAVDRHGREVYMPASQYKWDWGQATFLNALIHLYDSSAGAQKKIYLDYIRQAMDATYAVANGKHPNAVASGHGMAFLARITGDKKYLDKCNEIYADYLKIPRASNGGVSHRAETVELWDDTVYMLNMFLLEMYRLTGDEKYIADFVAQFNAHNEKLSDTNSGLWVHGWDADNIDYDDGCSILGWPDKLTRKSSEIWGRGNGWIGMALSDALNTIPKKSKYREPLKKAFLHYVETIAPLQDQVSGHWYQLMTLPAEPKNFLESSATAMFAYTITMGLKMEILDPKKYGPMVDRSYAGIIKNSLRDAGNGYQVPSRVSGGTCVGDENYYLNRKITEGTGFGYGSFILFGLAYEQFKGLRK